MPARTSQIAPIQIFRRGCQVASDGSVTDFTDADLAATAGGYDPALHQAPIVVGHPSTDDPAYGWIAGLAYSEADGLLLATPDQVDAQFADLVRAGRLKYVSASFWRPGAPTNPKPGGYYLRHVGFLGAQPPAVKGLRPAQFADATEDDTLTLSFEDPLPLVGDALADDADPTPTPEDSSMSAEIAALQAELDKRAQELADREQAIAQREANAAAQAAAIHHTECTAFAEGLVTQGRVLPRDKAALATLLATLPKDEAAAQADYAEAGDTPALPGAWLRGFLGRLPVQVDYAERAAHGEDSPTGGDQAARFGAEFDRTPALQAEFSDRATYVAYAKAQAAGRVSLTNKLTTGD